MDIAMTILFLAAAAIMALPEGKAAAADQTQAELLKTFREESIHITPGKGRCPAEFTMGEEGGAATAPAHKVRLGYEFHVARYEVPQGLWEAVQGENPSRWKGQRN